MYLSEKEGKGRQGKGRGGLKGKTWGKDGRKGGGEGEREREEVEAFLLENFSIYTPGQHTPNIGRNKAVV